MKIVIIVAMMMMILKMIMIIIMVMVIMIIMVIQEISIQLTHHGPRLHFAQCPYFFAKLHKIFNSIC